MATRLSLALASALLLLSPPVLAGDELWESYISLSMEFIDFPAFAGTKEKPNVLTKNLIENLSELQGSPMVIRVGGRSADRATFDANMTTATGACPGVYKSTHGGNRVPTVRKAPAYAYSKKPIWHSVNNKIEEPQCIGPKFFDSYDAFAEGTTFIHNFNLASINSGGAKALNASVPFACNALANKLVAWEFGSEPDLYSRNGIRNGSYDMLSNYVWEWVNTTKSFEARLKEACPEGKNMIKYLGPSLSAGDAKPNQTIIYKTAKSDADRVELVSTHMHMASGSDYNVTVGRLLNHTRLEEVMWPHVVNAYNIRVSDDTKYVMGEVSSVDGAGVVGVSDVFGAALWTVDMILQATTAVGRIKRVHMHQALNSLSSAWDPIKNEVRSSYYGLLAAARFLHTTKKIVRVRKMVLHGEGVDDSIHSGFAVIVKDSINRILIMNLKEHRANSTQPRGFHNFTLKLSPLSIWTTSRLTADGVDAKSGITYNGHSYDGGSMGKPVRVPVREANTTVKVDGNSRLYVAVADSEAIYLERIGGEIP